MGRVAKPALLAVISIATLSAVGASGRAVQKGANVAARTRRHVTARPRVGNIRDTSQVYQTVSCGFYFKLPRESAPGDTRYVFISQMDGRDAWMNLDGRDARLKFLRISPYPKERLGARRRIDYRAPGGYRVRVETTVVAVSDENNYEPTRFRVTLTVVRGGREARVRAVGYAGC